MSATFGRQFLCAAAFSLVFQRAPHMSRAVGTPGDGETFLRERLGLKAGEIADIEKGNPFADLAETTDEREVALFGVVRFDAPAPFIGENYRREGGPPMPSR